MARFRSGGRVPAVVAGAVMVGLMGVSAVPASASAPAGWNGPPKVTVKAVTYVRGAEAPVKYRVWSASKVTVRYVAYRDYGAILFKAHSTPSAKIKINGALNTAHLYFSGCYAGGRICLKATDQQGRSSRWTCAKVTEAG